MRFDPSHVDICITCLTDKPPTLPLREELPSLGVEVVLNAHGIGERASKHESKRALKEFRQQEQVKELKKRRIFPKSSKRIREKLAERKRIEHDLTLLHAFSYEAYEHELLHGFDTKSSSSSVETNTTSDSSGVMNGHSVRKKAGLKRSRNLWGRRRKRKDKQSPAQPQEQSTQPAQRLGTAPTEETPTIESLVGEDVFKDLLAPVNRKVSHPQQQNPENKTVSSSTPSRDPSSLSSKDPLTNMEVQFVTSPASSKYLPDLNTVTEFNESNRPIVKNPNAHVDANVQSAFANLSLSDPIYGASLSSPQHSTAKGVGIAKKSDDDEAAKQKPASNWVESSKQTFEQVTAEVYKASGIEPAMNQQATGIKGAQITKREKETDGTWMDSARHAFENVAAEVYKASGMEKNKPVKPLELKPQEKRYEQLLIISNFDDVNGSIRSSTSVGSLFAALSNVQTSLNQVQKMIRASPEVALVRQQEDGRTPLHALCDRGMPTCSTEATDLTETLVRDITNYEDLITFVLGSHPDACLIKDRNGDLPVHLLARRLMEWEAEWYEAIYKQAQRERDTSGKTAMAITKLYQAMSQCVERLLEPITRSQDLCQEPGSVGTILPLHIASIFTSSVSTLRLILEMYPEAAAVRCDLVSLQTFVPDNSLPLELHTNLSTDFPKWEVEATHEVHTEIKWSQSKATAKELEDCMRRSDLLFAYNPYVSPYRFEKSRIRRLESRIQLEAKHFVDIDSQRLSQAMERLWIWMCTFRDPETKRATYVNSVKRIVGSLPLQLVKFLASIETDQEATVLDVANKECARAINRRLDKTTELIIPLDGATPVSSMTSKSTKTTALQAWEEIRSARLALKDKGCFGYLCRMLFDVKESSVPTSFIILPYRLRKDKDGKLGMASPTSAPAAMKFAECLIQLTDPRSVLYYLDAKSTAHYGESLYTSTEDESFRLEVYAQIKTFETALLDLYQEGEAYLYLVDEGTGVPVLSTDSEMYPIILRDPSSIVQKLLPLMVMGMILMRGERALSVLVNVLLDETLTTVPPNWPAVAKEIGALLHSRQANQTKGIDFGTVREDLAKFMSSAPSKKRTRDRPKNGTTEWNVEISILKMLLEMNDSAKTFSGLEALREGEDLLAWTAAPASSSEVQAAMSQTSSSTAPKKLGATQTGSHTESIAKDASGVNSNTSSRGSPMLAFHQPQDETSDDERSDRSSEPGEKPEASKYYLLFRDLAIARDDSDESRDEIQQDFRRECHESGRVWNELTSSLERGGQYWENYDILKLKVKLAEEAKRLSFLGKKVSKIAQTEYRIFSKEEKLYEILHEVSAQGQECHIGGLADARRLLIRLCNLEDRVLCNEIRSQHLAIGICMINRDIVDMEREESESGSRSDATSKREGPPVNEVEIHPSDEGSRDDVLTSDEELAERSQATSGKSEAKSGTESGERSQKTVTWVKYEEATGRIEF